MNMTLRRRILTLIALIGFTLAMLLGGGAPGAFCDGPPKQSRPAPEIRISYPSPLSFS